MTHRQINLQGDQLADAINIMQASIRYGIDGQDYRLIGVEQCRISMGAGRNNLVTVTLDEGLGELMFCYLCGRGVWWDDGPGGLLGESALVTFEGRLDEERLQSLSHLHTRCLAAMNKAQERGVFVVNIPANCTAEITLTIGGGSFK